MGIQGLLPMLQEITHRGSLAQFKGKTLAVDAYVWLHKGAFGCAEQLVKGEKTTKFVDYAMARIHMLRHHGVTPYIVFDGGPLPAKKGTEVSRAKSREANLREAQRLEAAGNMSAARMACTKCVDITPEMAYQFIKALRAESIDYVVAPYEADAQLCFLEREGYVDGIITEDSDLLVFGCQRVIFKLDNVGNCDSIHRADFDKLVHTPMHGWTNLEFRRMAMLSGCDYLPSIQGIGIKTAHRMLRRFKTVERLLQNLRLEGMYPIPPSYQEDFTQAELAFVYQRVYDPMKKMLVPLNKFPARGLPVKDEKWVGVDIDPSIAQGMAAGDLHPETHERIEDLWPNYKPAPRVARPGMGPRIMTAPVKRGPMDAFITRTPSEPLPPPIGSRSSGPSKLSDQALYEPKKLVEVDSNIDDKPRPAERSKFFGAHRSAATQLEEAVQKAKEEIVWEKSDAPDVESQEFETFVTARETSTEIRRADDQVQDEWVDMADFEEEMGDVDGAMTSPVASHLSSPAVTPTRKQSRTQLEADDGGAILDDGVLLSSPPMLDDGFDFGDTPKHERAAPSSLTRHRRQQTRTGSPIFDSVPEPEEEPIAPANPILVEETQEEGASSFVAETPKLSRLAKLYTFGSRESVVSQGSGNVSRQASLRSVLVAPSSPYGDVTSTTALKGSTSLAAMSSSDGVEEEVVTPSMDVFRSTGSRLQGGRSDLQSSPSVRDDKSRDEVNQLQERDEQQLEAGSSFKIVDSMPATATNARKPNKRARSTPSSSSQCSSDPDPEDESRAKRAEIVAAGWKKRYEHTVSFPRPGSTRISKVAPATAGATPTSTGFGAKSTTPTVRKAKDGGKEWKDGEGIWHDSMFSPPPKSKTVWTREPEPAGSEDVEEVTDHARGVAGEVEGKKLSVLSPNVPTPRKEPLFTLKGMYGDRPAREAKTPVPRGRVGVGQSGVKRVREEDRMIGVATTTTATTTTPVRSPLSAFQPLKCASLERFRYVKKGARADGT